jgi:hypothetical protein
VPKAAQGEAKDDDAHCLSCGKLNKDPSKKFQKCGKCQKAYYCSRECQKAHWPAHKPHCVGLPAAAAVAAVPSGNQGMIQEPPEEAKYQGNPKDQAPVDWSVPGRRLLAEKGDIGHQYDLGIYYFQNDPATCTSKDIVEARRWFRLAAEQGHRRAQYWLGMSYFYADEADEYVEAFSWFRQAAERGYSKAQFQLGTIYLNGKGIGKNVREAVYWFRRAAAQGDEMAKEILRELRE